MIHPARPTLRQVKISKPFHIGTTAVTVEQIRQFDPEYRKGKGLPDEAASGISWHKAVWFCQWLSKTEGRTYRLPRDGDHTIYHLANGHSENIVHTSIDNGATWSKARPIYPQGETGSGMIRTREGALII